MLNVAFRPVSRRAASIGALVLAIFLAVPASPAITIQELRRLPKLTPAKFAAYFAQFRHERHETVQTPETFCRTQAGDCDDYATLAADILAERGYTTRLIAVRTAHDVHVVCYVEEIQGFLDYNNRRFLLRTVSCGPALDRIAAKVAKSLNSTWTSASEFKYDEGTRRLTKTVLRHSPFLALGSPR